MDTGRFDTWTRRRFGLGVSGLAAGLLGLAAGGETLAKKKKKKKKKDSPPSNPCAGKNICLNPAHTCAGANGLGFCYVQAFGGNICGTFGAGVSSCFGCDSGTGGIVCVLNPGCSEDDADFRCVEPA